MADEELDLVLEYCGGTDVCGGAFDRETVFGDSFDEKAVSDPRSMFSTDFLGRPETMGGGRSRPSEAFRES